MKKITYWLMSTVTALVLLFGYHTSTSSTAAGAGGGSSLAAPVQSGTGTASSGGSTGTTGGSTSSGSSSSGASSSTGSSTGGSTGSTTVTGDVAQTRWGPVEVQLTVQNNTVTDVTVVEYPNGNGRDREINARALPILVKETLSAQSARIDMVSGATYTSEGYLSSLQSALDKAGLA